MSSGTVPTGYSRDFVGILLNVQGIFDSQSSCYTFSSPPIERENVFTKNNMTNMVACGLQALPFEGKNTIF